MNMNPFDSNTSHTDPGTLAALPTLRTIEELDQWVLAMGGKELTREESSRVRAEVRWHDIPGEAETAGLR